MAHLDRFGEGSPPLAWPIWAILPGDRSNTLTMAFLGHSAGRD